MKQHSTADAGATTIVLATNCEDPALELRQPRRFSDSSGFSSQLFVRCHGFTGVGRFFFSEASFHRARAALRVMDQELRGDARFDEEFEHQQFLQFSMRSGGHVLVSGQLVHLSEEPVRFSFAFQTDQTCLAPLIRSLDSLDR